MADISLTTADKVNVDTLTECQHIFVAASDITAGAPVYITSTGKVAHSDANATPTLSACWGIATRTVLAGEPVTVVRRGIMSGWDLSGLAYGAKVYVSDTVGRIADAESSTTGLTVGSVIPLMGTTLGTSFDKGLLVEVALDTD